jgi:uncharacterized damage-inducible protein DinB
MLLDDVKSLYNYNYWANDRIVRTVEGLSEAQIHVDMHNGIGTMRMTLVHILNGERTWRMRWQGERPTPLLRQENFPSVIAFQARWREEEQKMLAFLATLRDDDMARVIQYSSTMQPDKILAWPFWQQLVHVVNHGTQHRSEIAMKLTELNHSPGELGMSVFFNLPDA